MPTALITGGGVRLGKAIALELLAHGYDLLLRVNSSTTGANEVVAAAQKAGRRCDVHVCDLAIASDVDALIATIKQTHNSLDVLVNNAAIFERVPFSDITRAQYARMQAINTEAPFFLTQGLVPLLLAAARERGDAVVVNLVDNAHERPMNHYAHYMVSKAGIAMLTKCLATELGPDIRACGIAPGAVAFPDWWTDAQKDEVLKRVPLRRSGTPEDIATAVRFVVEHRYLSGVILPVDGGRQGVF